MIPILATVIAVVSLGLILTERLDHTIAAMGGATLMVGAGKVLGFLPRPKR